jgi:hypothetical protein
MPALTGMSQLMINNRIEIVYQMRENMILHTVGIVR